MKNFIRFLTIVGMVITIPCIAQAVPNLQLDILNGTYDPVTQSTISAGSTFTLQAFLSGNFSNETFYISAALVPITTPPVGNLGSFTFAGTSVNITGDMVYGTPPNETVATQLSDNGDLATHSIFDTYFSQFAFTFNSLQTVPAYDVQDGTGASGNMYVKEFLVDTSGLSSGYAIHFDLYNTKVYLEAKGNNPEGDVDGNDFAPFSHDAQSKVSEIVPPPQVPEPATLFLLGLGMIGMGLVRRKIKK